MRNPTQKLLLLLLLASVAAAQSKDYWESKDYRQWTEKECRKLLEDSPWANLHNQTTERLKNFVFLIGGGGVRVPLSIYRTGEGASRKFQFVFPREYNGRPFIGPGDKTLKLEFNHPNIRGTAERILIEFRIER
jgi:hypothetical protein